jgi:hypothetical protein
MVPAMSNDQVASLKIELQQFVLQTQARLRSLQESVYTLKATSRKGTSASIAVDGEQCFKVANSLRDQNEVAHAAASNLSLRTPNDEVKTSECTHTNAACDSQLHETSDAEDRLAAIKRRLADRIGSS